MGENQMRIGLIGASRIAGSAVIVPARERDDLVIQAVAARDPVRGQAFAAAHGIPDVYPDYDALLTADDIDLVYIATPPSSHADLAIRAIAAGKPALVEKPFALSAAEAERVYAASLAAAVPIFEAMHSLHHPLFARLRMLLDERAIGEVRHIDAQFETPITQDGSDFRWSRALGGGALMDLGVYPLAWSRWIAGERFDVTDASAVRRYDVDAAITASLRFDTGITATVRASMISEGHIARMLIEGTAGTIEIDNPLAPQDGNCIRIRTAGGVREQSVDGPSTYRAQLDAVVRAIRGEAPFPFPDDDYVRSMEAVDRIMAAAA